MLFKTYFKLIPIPDDLDLSPKGKVSHQGFRNQKYKSVKKIMLYTALSVFSFQALAQQTVKGRVYEDVNKNGRQDKNEKGIAGVGVSNGVQVVRTDSKGNYELPANKDQIIFAIKPGGYAFPLNEHNLPQFYYIHKPQGSPQGFKYEGVPPTGALPKSIDFALHSAKGSDDFKVLLFGDPQPYTMDQIEYFDEAIIREVAARKDFAFGISLGDLVGDTLDLHLPYLDKIKKLGTSWYNV